MRVIPASAISIILAILTSSPLNANAQSRRCEDILIDSVDVRTMTPKKRRAQVDRYIEEIRNVREVFEAAERIATRVPGATILSFEMGNVRVQRPGRQPIAQPRWQVATKAGGHVSFGVTSERSRREEVYAELVFAKSNLDFLKFSSSNGRGRAQDDSDNARMTSLRRRIAELESKLRSM